MNINTKMLTKVAQDHRSTTLQHKDGHTITIAHDKLKPEHAAALLKLPMQHKADGGEVTNPSPSPAPIDRTTKIKGGTVKGASGADITKPSTWFWGGGDVTPVNEQQDSDADQAIKNINAEPLEPRTELPPKQQGLEDFSAEGALGKMSGQDSMGMQPDATAAPGQDYSNINLGAGASNAAPTQVPGSLGAAEIDKTVGAINSNANNEAALSATKQPLLEEQARQSQTFADTAKDAYNQMEQDSAAAIKAFQDGKINPDHYMQSLSTGGKLSTAIGLILGGIGGGLAHGGNPAMDFLNKQIDRDIDAQKADMGNKATLFGMLHQKLGDKLAATKAAQAFGMDAYAAKIQAEANKYGSATAQNNAVIATSQLRQQSAQLRQQSAIMNSALRTLGSTNLTPAMQGQAVEAYLSNRGDVSPADKSKAAEELATVQGMNKMQQDFHAAQEKLSKEALGGALTPGKRDAIIGPLVQQLQVSIDHRYNHDAVEKLQSALFSAPGDMKSTGAIKMDALQKVFDEQRAKATPTLNRYGIPSPKLAPTGHNVQK